VVDEDGLTPEQRARHERIRLKREALERKREDETNAREQAAQECDAFRTKMRLLLNAYAKVFEESTDLGHLRVWACGALAFIETTNVPKLMYAAWSDLRLAFGHDSRTVVKKVAGADFDNRLAAALEEFNQLAKAQQSLPTSPGVVVLEAKQAAPRDA
jgi:hypothetical protein